MACYKKYQTYVDSTKSNAQRGEYERLSGQRLACGLTRGLLQFFSFFVRASWPYLPPAASHTPHPRSMHCPSTKIPRSLVPQQNVPVEMLRAFIQPNTEMIYGVVFSPSSRAIAFDSSNACSFVSRFTKHKETIFRHDSQRSNHQLT